VSCGTCDIQNRDDIAAAQRGNDCFEDSGSLVTIASFNHRCVSIYVTATRREPFQRRNGYNARYSW
jgi:hypothetical protein